MRRFLWPGVWLAVGLVSLPIAFGAGFAIADQQLPGYVELRRVWRRISALAPSAQSVPPAESSDIDTNLLRLRSERFPWTLGTPSYGRGGGGLALLGDAIVGVDKNGVFFHYAGRGDMQRLPLTLQTNLHELLAAKETTEAFRILDIAATRDGDRGELFVSYHYWYPDEQCKTTRVSRLIVEDVEALLSANLVASQDDWTLLYESRPCVEYATRDRSGFQANTDGGRLVPDGQGGLYVGIGDHFLDGVNNSLSAAQDSDISYGKIIRIDLETLSARVYARGLRNPEGLMLDRAGNLWETEHGPKGGDEINLIRDQGNYGWPLTTYGTQYYELEWRLNAVQGRHEGRDRGFEIPAYAFVPSIGISNLIQLNDGIDRWRDDLLVSSLMRKRLFRVRLQEGRVIFAEPIEIGERIRDLVQKSDGTIVLWTDSRSFYELTPLPQNGEHRAPDVVGTCGVCHGFTPTATSAAGPSLWGVYGREIGSTDYAGYSASLRNADGVWDEDKLRAFVLDPQSVIPGTTMPQPPAPDPETMEHLLRVLRSLH
jgi:cytochrome c2